MMAPSLMSDEQQQVLDDEIRSDRRYRLLALLIVCLGVLLAGAISPWLHPLGTAGIAIASVAVATLISAWREVPWLGGRNSDN